MNWKEVSRALGKLLLAFSLSFLPAILLAAFDGEQEALITLSESLAVAAALGTLFALLGRSTTGELFRRETLIVVAASWILAAVVGALPFWFGGTLHSFTDAFFESMSGLTTTGSTVLTEFDSQPRAILFWRQTLHFVGGLGIVVLFVAVFGQQTHSAGKLLFRAEVSAGPLEESSRPRIRDAALDVTKIYLGLNIALATLLVLAGMPLFDSIANAVATIATGGFSPNSQSIYGYHSAAVEWIIILFMFLAGTNFALHIAFLKGKFLYHKDLEFLGYAGVLLGGTLIAATLMWAFGLQTPNSPEAIPYLNHPGGFSLRDTLFAVCSIGTSTGFATVDYDGWPPVVKLFLLLLMISGACAGSTSGGLKMVRWMVIFRYLPHFIFRQARPRDVRQLRFGNRLVRRDQINEILGFTALWFTILIVNSTLVSLLSPHQQIIESISAVAATMSNIGPGLGIVGPTDSFASQAPLVKWILSLGMVIGRLEIYPVLVLVNLRYWNL